MNNWKASAAKGTRLAILMLALLASLVAGQTLSAQPSRATCSEPPCKPVSEAIRQPPGTRSDERRSQNVSSSVAKRGSPNSTVTQSVGREEKKACDGVLDAKADGQRDSYASAARFAEPSRDLRRATPAQQVSTPCYGSCASASV